MPNLYQALDGSIPVSPEQRSAAAFPADYRRVLEASNLPVEVATAIADRLEQCGGPNCRNDAIEEAAKVCEGYVMAICEDESNGGASHDAACRSLAEQIRALKLSSATEEKR